MILRDQQSIKKQGRLKTPALFYVCNLLFSVTYFRFFISTSAEVMRSSVIIIETK